MEEGEGAELLCPLAGSACIVAPTSPRGTRPLVRLRAYLGWWRGGWWLAAWHLVGA